ncbi:amidohydrolase family protein [Marinihelvus fidelis]|uniref:Amidohydrolase family protein n=1 Tax=Marinihelvus fidelis TaxID=2613842 RepID=A0A5N0TCS6_9GAMM|nr:amidohydrolase family protein [Marinihelvus fidelis]KAA9132770.1 amidohydrolase family protein [Marinihelvus fidelis]
MRTRTNLNTIGGWLLAGLAATAMLACKPADEPASTAAAPAEPAPATTATAPATAGSGEPAERAFAWYLEGKTPAGHTRINELGDGKITSDSFIHWNNREWTVKSEVQLDDAGLPVAQRITGISPFQAPIDESFELSQGEASWKTVGSEGGANVDGRAFYLPAEGGALESLGALVRAAAESIDGSVRLLPAGTARAEPVHETTVPTPDGEQALTLYSITGIGFTPQYAWMDEKLHLAALDFRGYLGMVPEGWDPAVLERLGRVQLEQSAAHIEKLSGTLAHPLDGPLLIENVDVVDVESGELLTDHHVLVVDGKIAQVSAEPIDSGEARAVDGQGRTLIPGLWDMHGHFSLEQGVLNVAGGITSVRDIGSVHEQIMELTRRYDSGEVIGPHTYRAGFMDKAGPYASGSVVNDLEEALARVDFYADNGYLQVKLYSSIEPEWVAPIAERAHARGLRVSGHIPAFMSAEQAVRAGYDEIQHINMVFLNFIVGDEGDTRQQIRFTGYGDGAAGIDLDSEEVESFITLLKDNDVTVDATAAIFDTMLSHVPGEPDPTFAAIIDHLPPNVARPMYNPEMVLGENWPESGRRQSQMLKKLHDAGVQLVPGSDSIAAFTIHRELELYAEAGIPNAEVLRIGTLDSARIVGADERTGSIAVGKDADLVLLDGNPLEDMSAIRRAVLVLKGDTAYEPSALYQAMGVKPFVDPVYLGGNERK